MFCERMGESLEKEEKIQLFPGINPEIEVNACQATGGYCISERFMENCMWRKLGPDHEHEEGMRSIIAMAQG